MKVHLQYGRDGLDASLPGRNVTLIEPRFVDGLADEHAAFVEALRDPIGTPPLRDSIRSDGRLAVVIPDITRPLPSHRLLPWLFEELAHVEAEKITVINGTGSHRVNTREELARMVGDEILARYDVVNHDSHDRSTLVEVGLGDDGQPVAMARAYVEAHRRIVMGFIEPHFMAGFSGGLKGIFPAVADIDSIMRYHDARTIGDPGSTWGRLEGNPTQAKIRRNASLVPPDFCINVTLNSRREITRFFCGHPIAAHEEGCAFSRSTAMVPCPRPFPIVVTTNSGYPLDQNLYQAVKGMSAAAQVVAEGGLIVAAARCNDGFPAHGNFRQILFDHPSPRAILETITAPGFSLYDQWEAQILALICSRARVALKSDLADDDVRRAHLEPIRDVAECVERELGRLGEHAPVAVLPEGPMTIPYLVGA